MFKNKNFYNTLFIVNYISSILMIIFTASIKFYYANTWADNGFYFHDKGVGVFYFSIIFTIFLISMTIYYYTKLKKVTIDK